MTDHRPHHEELTWLVPHDFSSCAEAAADLALDDLLSRRNGGRLLLLHVFTVNAPASALDSSSGSGWAATVVERGAMVEASRSLERVAERLRSRVKSASALSAHIEIEAVARLGTPAEAILEEAEAHDAERIVIGTHGRTGLMHVMLGSVAERVVRRARVPVIVAHARELA